MRDIFALDHFRCMTLYPDHAVEHENLVYTCVTCNQAKRDQNVFDPLTVFTGSSVWVGTDGVVHAETPEAARLIKLRALNSKRNIEFRMLWIGIFSLAAQHNPELHRRLLQFPNDLPDLWRLRPPDGNARPDGVAKSYVVLREIDELPPSY